MPRFLNTFAAGVRIYCA